MNTELFSQAMNEIDDRYYAEAVDFTPGKSRFFVQWIPAAACLALAVAALLLVPGFLNREDSIIAAPNATIAANPTTEPQRQEIRISMADVYFNELSPLSTDYALCYRFLIEFYTKTVWDSETATNYYGRNYAPQYVPNGLIPSTMNGFATVLFDPEGKVVHDTAAFDFYHAYREDGYPELVEETVAYKGIHIEFSKTGLIRCCSYLLPENEIKTSLIGSTVVTFGYRAMPHGPYDPETHEPSGYYDLYISEFELDGIEFFILGEQLDSPEELVKTVSSIILGENVILDK